MIRLTQCKDLLAITALFICSIPLVFSTELSLDERYPNVRTISSSEFNRQFGEVLIVDVRSPFEFSVLHITNSINIPIANKGFIPELKELRATDKRAIVMYCNGGSCEKSYQAVSKAQAYNIKNVYAYNLGILSWAREFPQRTTFLGESGFSFDQLISAKKFAYHNLSYQMFVAKIHFEAWVIDIREPFQRELTPFNFKTIQTPANNFNSIFKRIKGKPRPLLIFDAAGEQVRWLQYMLEAEGIKNYYFLRGGVKSNINKIIQNNK